MEPTHDVLVYDNVENFAKPAIYTYAVFLQGENTEDLHLQLLIMKMRIRTHQHLRNKLLMLAKLQILRNQLET